MPDDVTTGEVTEQESTQGGQQQTDIVDTLDDEENAFNDETEDGAEDEGEDQSAKGLQQKDDTDDDEKESSGKKDKVEPEEDDEEDDADDDEEDDLDEDDEDLKRGKALIEQQRLDQQQAEQHRLEQQQAQQPGQGNVYNPKTFRHNPNSLEVIRNALPQNFFPDEVTLNDGTKLDFKSYIESDPELPIMMAAIAKNIVDQMVSTNYLVTGDKHNQVYTEIDNKLFMRTLTNKANGIQNPENIWNSQEFQAWLPTQPEEIRVLFNSRDAHDHIAGFNRFISSQGKDRADKKISDLDEKRKKSKEKFDSVHKSTVKNKRAAKKTSTVDPKSEEMEGFMSEDDEDDMN